MRKLVILLGMLLVIGMVLPVMAVKPDPVPPVDPFTAIWNAIEGLQTQITDNQQSQVVFKHGEAQNFDRISPPEGFEVSDCDIIVRPKETVYLAIRYNPGTGEQDYHAISFTFKGVDKTPTFNEWEIFAMVNYVPDVSGSSVVFGKEALYTVICSK